VFVDYAVTMSLAPSPSDTARLDRLFESILPQVAFDGFDLATMRNGAVTLGYPVEMIDAWFPQGKRDLYAQFARFIDRRLIAALHQPQTSRPSRTRDRIAQAIRQRFEILEPYRLAEEIACAFWAVSRLGGKKRALHSLYQSADVIWHYAGDTSTDYNRYTKRILLAKVLGQLTVQWIAMGPITDMTQRQSWHDLVDHSLTRVINAMQKINPVKPVINRLWRLGAPMRRLWRKAG
jgi:ubiquinone biosynthesis protein COQ9